MTSFNFRIQIICSVITRKFDVKGIDSIRAKIL
jgi:hypothetical protein